MSDKWKKAKTVGGREVIYCDCHGQRRHAWMPNGGGMQILNCPSWEPTQIERPYDRKEKPA